MVLWCQLLKNCPMPELDPVAGNSPTTTVASVAYDNSHFTKIMLLYFKHSDRYLCVDDTGRVYSRKHVSVIFLFVFLLSEVAVQCSG